MKPMTTVTFDPAVYKLVPLSRWKLFYSETSDASYQLPGVVEHSGEPVAWADALKISDLPEVDEALHNFSHDSTEDNAVCVVLKVLQAPPAPAQPSAAKYTPPTEIECDEFRRTPGSFNDMVRAIHEHGYHTYAGAANVHFGEFYKAKFDAAIASQPSAEALVQAALEAAAKWFDDRYNEYVNEFGSIDPATGTLEFGTGHYGEIRAEHAAELVENAAAIRALSAQQIIESCKEKS